MKPVPTEAHHGSGSCGWSQRLPPCFLRHASCVSTRSCWDTAFRTHPGHVRFGPNPHQNDLRTQARNARNAYVADACKETCASAQGHGAAPYARQSYEHTRQTGVSPISRPRLPEPINNHRALLLEGFGAVSGAAPRRAEHISQ